MIIIGCEVLAILLSLIVDIFVVLFYLLCWLDNVIGGISLISWLIVLTGFLWLAHLLVHEWFMEVIVITVYIRAWLWVRVIHTFVIVLDILNRWNLFARGPHTLHLEAVLLLLGSLIELGITRQILFTFKRLFRLRYYVLLVLVWFIWVIRFTLNFWLLLIGCWLVDLIRSLILIWLLLLNRSIIDILVVDTIRIWWLLRLFLALKWFLSFVIKIVLLSLSNFLICEPQTFPILDLTVWLNFWFNTLTLRFIDLVIITLLELVFITWFFGIFLLHVVIIRLLWIIIEKLVSHWLLLLLCMDWLNILLLLLLGAIVLHLSLLSLKSLELPL